MNTRYFFLKLGNGNREADYWLNQAKVKNVFNRPAVAIFFGKTKLKDIETYVDMNEKYRQIVSTKKEEYSERKSPNQEDFPSYANLRNQIKPFIDAGKGKINAKFVTIISQQGLIYIYEPDGQVFDMQDEKYKEYDKDLIDLKIKAESDKNTVDVHFPKVMFVKNIKRCTKVPDVLATLSCNNYLNRGTCREINPEKNWGAIQAIKYCLGELREKPESEEQRLSLLGWHQLETLVFLILKNAGVHPSAWRGGTLPQIDLVAKNYNPDRDVIIGTTEKVVFKPMGIKTFQIKRGNVKQPDKNADYTIALDYKGKRKEEILTKKWLIETMKKQPDTKDWFEKSINWFY